MRADKTNAVDRGFVEASSQHHDLVTWHPQGHVDKWDADQTHWVQTKTGITTPSAKSFEDLKIKPYETVHTQGNLLTTAGLTRLVLLLTGSGLASTNTTARIGTGNGAGSAAVADVALSATAGAANQWWQIMDATFPTTAAAVVTYKSTFATADGNYAWNEWAIDISAATVTSSAVVGACMLNHKTGAALGTKASGSTWAFTVTITFS
jgi:hypothetical protein